MILQVQVYFWALFQQRSYQLFFHFLIPCFSPLLILRHNDKSLDPFTKRLDTRHGNTAATNTTIQIPLISRKLLYLSSGLNKLQYIWYRKWRVFGCSIKRRLESGRGAYNKSHNQSELVQDQHKPFFWERERERERMVRAVVRGAGGLLVWGGSISCGSYWAHNLSHVTQQPSCWCSRNHYCEAAIKAQCLMGMLFKL